MLTSSSLPTSSASRLTDRARYALPLGLSLLAVAAVVLWPGFALARRLSAAALTALLQDQTAITALINSLVTAGASTALAVGVGVPVAWLLARSDVRWQGVLALLLLLPGIVPPHIGSLAWVQVYGPAGLLSRIVKVPWNLYSPGGIIALLTMYALPPVILFSAAALREVPPDLEEAARAAGARPWTAFRTVILPAILPGVVAGSATAFAGGLGNFGAPAMLGIPANYTVLTTYIYRQVTAFGTGSLARTAALSALLLLPMVPVYLAELRVLRVRTAATQGAAPVRHRLGGWRLPAEAFLWVLVLLTGILPLAAMVLTSLQPAFGVPLSPATMTLKNYAAVLTAGPGKAFISSLWLAAGAALICSGIGVVLAYWMWRWPSRTGRLVRFVVGLPYAVPGIVLGVAMILGFLRPVLGLRVYGTAWLLLIAYTARFLSVGMRGTMAALQGVDHTLEQAARAAGAGLWAQLRTITLPLIGPGVMAGAMLLFLMAFSELTVSSLLTSTRAMTIGVAIYNLEEGGYSLQSTALATVTVAVIVAGMALLDRLTPTRMRRLLPWRL